MTVSDNKIDKRETEGIVSISNERYNTKRKAIKRSVVSCKKIMYLNLMTELQRRLEKYICIFLARKYLA